MFNAFLGLVVEGDTWIAASSLGLYKSVDQGKNWTYYNPGTGLLGSARFSKSGNRIIANLAKPVGFTYLFFTDDQGKTWKNLEPTLTGSYGYDLIHCKNHLYSARDNGLWRLTITSDTDDEISAHSVLGQNFPNPFVGKTVIPVDLQETGNVELLILDGTGNPVRRLFAEAKTVGRQYFDIDLNGLAPGIYIYRLTAGGYQESRSMLLLR
jgi:hypothetical protein